MRRRYWLSVLGLLAIFLSALAHAGDTPSQPSDYRETPNPFRLFIDQWSSYPALPGGLTLEFLRSADEETAEVSLREAVLIGLKSNPGIEVGRLEPFRAAEQTMTEQSVFDPTLNLQFNKDYTIDPRGSKSGDFSTSLQITRNNDYNLSLQKLLRTGARLEVSFLNNRLVSNFPTQVLKPQYRPHLGIGRAHV